MKKAIFMIIVFLFAAGTVSACAGHEPMTQAVTESAAVTKAAAETLSENAEIKIEDETEKETESETQPEDMFPEERQIQDGQIRSYLTGLMVPVGIGTRRPIAIMMSNDKEARPQYGINRAGVVYEAPVEGTMNRYMAVIEDYDNLERIGSVRSCRTYYTYFAREWDAVYAHYGQSTFALPYLKNVDNINGLEGIGDTAFYRSKDKKSPHNAYSSGERLNRSIEKLNYRTEYDEDYKGHFKFAKPDTELKLDEAISIEAYKLTPGYPYNKPWFTYSEEDGLYHRYQYGEEHMGDEGPIEVKNVIFQYSPTSTYATTQYLNINVHEPTYGYYFTNGRGRPVSIVKDGEFGVTHFYDADGEEIVLNNGKTWICIIQSSRFSDTEICGKDGSKTN